MRFACKEMGGAVAVGREACGRHAEGMVSVVDRAGSHGGHKSEITQGLRARVCVCVHE
jgi:hypothetical protein